MLYAWKLLSYKSSETFLIGGQSIQSAVVLSWQLLRRLTPSRRQLHLAKVM